MSVSATTRFPRPGEEDGVHYHFLSREDFQQRVASQDFLEWAEFAGNLYGTPRGPIQERLAAGERVFLEVEIEGARQVRRALPDALLVFLAPPSWEVLVDRLLGRGTETPQQVERRLDRARTELTAEPEFDITLTNADVDEVVADLVALYPALGSA